jgi:hypothetical protein
MRKMLGRTSDFTGHSSLYWSMIKGPAMNQAFFFQSTRGILELFRKGWQYGQFVVTAQQKDNPQVAAVNKKFLKYMIALQTSGNLYGLAMTIPGAWALGTSPVTMGYFFNYFWSIYGSMINGISLKYIADCEKTHPKANSEAGKKYKVERNNIAAEISAHSDKIGTRFFDAYQAYRAGDPALAVQIWREMVESDDPHKMMNYVKLAEEKLQELGVNLKDVKRGDLR